MDYTKNLKLSKPSYDDDVDIQIINTNMDIIDENINNIDLSPYALKKDYLPLTGGNITGELTVQNKNVVTIIETLTNDNGYCIKYSDGYMEQHYKVATTTDNFFRLNFLIPFIDTNYVIGTCGEAEDVGEYGSFVDYVGDTVGALKPEYAISKTGVTLSSHYAWAFGHKGKQKVMVNVWGKWR